MKHLVILMIFLSLFSCEKEYEIISDQEFKKKVIQDTLFNNSNYTVMSIGESAKDNYPRLFVKANHLYLFERDCELSNDSIIHCYYPAFIIDSDGEFRKNGIWIYAKFENEGYFPFNTKIIKYSVDSIPSNWNKKLPVDEGVYFYNNNRLELISSVQSEEKFKEKEMNGFYFIPNRGRLFDKITIKDLD